tara:strand:+ start:5715 stop:6500 length:786 start_codon:yes stop_codon:yes gene_type:complete
MASFTGSALKDVYKDILHTSNSNTGLSTTIKQITCGDGDGTSLYLSTQNAKIQPAADSTTNTVILDKDGNALVTVDSTNDLVKAGIGQHTVNTQYLNFGLTSAGLTAASHSTHYAIPISISYTGVSLQDIGTGTNPDTSVTISTNSSHFIGHYFHLCDNITIDKVIFWVGGDAATGDTVRCHLMSYDIETTSGATSGDLSGGVVCADGADIVSAGYEQNYYQQMTVQSADVDAGKVLVFAFRQDSANSDYGIHATVKYHLR